MTPSSTTNQLPQDQQGAIPRYQSLPPLCGKLHPVPTWNHQLRSSGENPIHSRVRFKAVYNPGREIAVDEAMIKFQGRSSFKQYMPKKPIKRGIKVWVLGDSSNGYFSRLEVYTGKKGNTVEKNLGSRVVKELTLDFQHRWHRVYFNNFFTSKTLLYDLEQVEIYGIGTARSDRKFFPQDLKNVQLNIRYVAEVKYMYSEQ